MVGANLPVIATPVVNMVPPQPVREAETPRAVEQTEQTGPESAQQQGVSMPPAIIALLLSDMEDQMAEMAPPGDGEQADGRVIPDVGANVDEYA
ncbi:MAG: hypothetical protein PVJ57_01540 [Phycisphaerae bacterium]|jgi:hypothetical protein